MRSRGERRTPVRTLEVTERRRGCVAAKAEGEGERVILERTWMSEEWTRGWREASRKLRTQNVAVPVHQNPLLVSIPDTSKY